MINTVEYSTIVSTLIQINDFGRELFARYVYTGKCCNEIGIYWVPKIQFDINVSIYYRFYIIESKSFSRIVLEGIFN